MSMTEGSKFQEQMENQNRRQKLGEPFPPPVRVGLASDPPMFPAIAEDDERNTTIRANTERLKELTKEFNQVCNRLAIEGVHVEASIDCPSIFLMSDSGSRKITTLRTAAWRRA